MGHSRVVNDEKNALPAPANDPAAGHAVLTPRQTEILQLIAEGESTSHIAERLHLSQTTVRNHVARALAGLGVHTRVQAIVAASGQGLIRMPKSG
jgi:DNA-binding NarL/FixJ family response regulator